jgi:hypothetical protein
MPSKAPQAVPYRYQFNSWATVRAVSRHGVGVLVGHSMGWFGHKILLTGRSKLGSVTDMFTNYQRKDP